MDASELTTVKELTRMWKQPLPDTMIEDWVCIATRQDFVWCSGHARANYRLLEELCGEVCGGEYRNLDFDVRWLGGWIQALVVPPSVLENEGLKNALSLARDGGCIEDDAIFMCEECRQPTDTHDSTNQPFCTDGCEAEFHRRPCKDCGWSFDIRDVDGDVADEEHTCTDCQVDREESKHGHV